MAWSLTLFWTWARHPPPRMFSEIQAPEPQGLSNFRSIQAFSFEQHLSIANKEFMSTLYQATIACWHFLVFKKLQLFKTTARVITLTGNETPSSWDQNSDSSLAERAGKRHPSNLVPVKTLHFRRKARSHSLSATLRRRQRQRATRASKHAGPWQPRGGRQPPGVGPCSSDHRLSAIRVCWVI